MESSVEFINQFVNDFKIEESVHKGTGKLAGD
jgi:hypothetical protein